MPLIFLSAEAPSPIKAALTASNLHSDSVGFLYKRKQIFHLLYLLV